MQGMKQLDRLEALAQGLIEGVFNRLFQTQLHPSNLAHHPAEAGKIETRESLAVVSDHTARRWLLQLETRQLRLGEPVVNIGRSLDNDIILSDPTVSRYHAQLRWREGRYHLYPPMPLNGAINQGANGAQKTERFTPRTTVNKQQVARHPLAPDDVIALGNTTLTVIVEREQD